MCMMMIRHHAALPDVHASCARAMFDTNIFQMSHTHVHNDVQMSVHVQGLRLMCMESMCSVCLAWRMAHAACRMP